MAHVRSLRFFVSHPTAKAIRSFHTPLVPETGGVAEETKEESKEEAPSKAAGEGKQPKAASPDKEENELDEWESLQPAKQPRTMSEDVAGIRRAVPLPAACMLTVASDSSTLHVFQLPDTVLPLMEIVEQHGWNSGVPLPASIGGLIPPPWHLSSAFLWPSQRRSRREALL